LRLDGGPVATTRDQFVVAASQPLRAYVERFASSIPVAKNSEFDAIRRAERIACLVHLCAYEGWARHQRMRRTDP
jgi:hypothetical protein